MISLSKRKVIYFFLHGGLEIEEIAKILMIQPNSVFKIRRKILQKLNAKNITHAITKANQAGILNIESSDFIIRAQNQKRTNRKQFSRKI